MRLAIFILISGCAAFVPRSGVVPLQDLHPLYPHEVDYELLGNGLGEACSFGERQAIESARFSALKSIPKADGLFSMRYKIVKDVDQYCVTMTGRGYRILQIRAVRSCGGEEWRTRTSDEELKRTGLPPSLQ